MSASEPSGPLVHILNYIYHNLHGRNSECMYSVITHITSIFHILTIGMSSNMTLACPRYFYEETYEATCLKLKLKLDCNDLPTYTRGTAMSLH